MTPEEFFYKEAGYSYDPRTETEEQGRLRSARELAGAERWASEVGLTFEWEEDPEGDCEGVRPTYGCVVRASDGRLGASLGVIYFMDGGGPYDGDPYRRVVEAELALETMS